MPTYYGLRTLINPFDRTRRTPSLPTKACLRSSLASVLAPIIARLRRLRAIFYACCPLTSCPPTRCQDLALGSPHTSCQKNRVGASPRSSPNLFELALDTVTLLFCRCEDLQERPSRGRNRLGHLLCRALQASIISWAISCSRVVNCASTRCTDQGTTSAGNNLHRCRPQPGAARSC